MLKSGSKDHQHYTLCQHCQIMQGFPKLTNSYSHFSKKLWTMADTKSIGLVAIVKDNIHVVANGWCG